MEKLEKNFECELEICGQGIDGEGIARKDGKVIFVSGALKGETVWAKILQCKKDFCFAKAINIIKEADFRVKPICPSFPVCGGCSLMHMSYDSQLELKRTNVKACLEKALRIELDVSAPIPSPSQLYYRNKIKAPIGLDKNNSGALIGFYAPRSHRIVPFETCFLQKKIHHAAIKIIRDFADKNRDKIYDPISEKGNLRYATVQDFSGTIIVSIIALSPDKINLTPLNDALKAYYGESYALYTSKNTSKGNVIQGEKIDFFDGKNELKEKLFDIKISFHPFAFRQVNDEVKSMLYSSAAQLCGKDGVVIDAYSGGGLMSMIFAKNAKKVYAIEIDKNACNSATHALEENKIDNVEVICGDCQIELSRLEGRIDKSNLTLVLDPPRKGCDIKVLDSVKNFAPTKLIYISCNPATLARDLAILLHEKDWIIKLIQPYDMFPQTSHIETLVYLERV